jgi:hypothetical protein
MSSNLEATLYFELKRAGLRGFVCEHNFKGLTGKRRWRFDVAFKDQRVAVECQGGLYSQGKHSRPKGYENDAQKSAEAQICGWIVIYVTPNMLKVKKGQVECEAVRLVRAALKGGIWTLAVE